LVDDSLALDAAAQLTPPVITDQRGVVRPQGLAPDIGAYELQQNSPPTIEDIPDQSVQINSPTPPIPFTIGDNETAADDLIVEAEADSALLIADIELGGSGTDRTVTVTPVIGRSGTAIITITVTDEGGLTAQDSFELSIGTSNSPPTITSIDDQTIDVNSSTDELIFRVDDDESLPQLLTVTANSSDSTLVPNDPANIAIARVGPVGGIRITPAADQTGTTTITLTVTDQRGLFAMTQFSVTVRGIVADPVVQLSPEGPDGPDPAVLDGSKSQPTSWSAQRSDLRRIVVQLGAPIDSVRSADLVLTNLGVNAPIDDDVAVPITDGQLTLSGDGTRVTISFDSGQLADGVYQLELKSAITGGDDFVFTGDADNRFFVLTGDFSGSGLVHLDDFTTFGYWFESQVPTAPAYADVDNSGTVDIDDFDGLDQNFNTRIVFPDGSQAEPAVEDGEKTDLEALLVTLQNPVDVNGDGSETARDALNIINELARIDRPIDVTWSKFDANRNYQVTSSDALFVINRLGVVSPDSEEVLVLWPGESQQSTDADDREEEVVAAFATLLMAHLW
jgi:hypothetical protein